MSKCLVLFVEGDTEVEFYKQVVANVRKLHPAGRFDTNIEYRNVKGVQEGQRIDVGAAEWLILLYLCSCGYLNYLKIVYEYLI